MGMTAVTPCVASFSDELAHASCDCMAACMTSMMSFAPYVQAYVDLLCGKQGFRLCICYTCKARGEGHHAEPRHEAGICSILQHRLVIIPTEIDYVSRKSRGWQTFEEAVLKTATGDKCRQHSDAFCFY